MDEKEKKEAEKKACQKVLALIAKIYLPLLGKAIEKRNSKKTKS